tara:strand:+ start:3570 stop:4475 length:906 start_codon:yes stop_codon:yes gene_type:complete
MRIHSGFDGIGTAYQAGKNIGLPIERYYANEIDPFAIEIANKNHPDIIQLGDIINQSPPNNVDLMIAGSPCQGFSFAGKQLAFSDNRSRLFFEWIHLFNKIKPKWFLFENVKMKQEHQDVISKYLGVQPIEINSAVHSPASRKRLYWTNIPIAPIKMEDICLQDILEDGYVDRYKAHCIDANYFKGGNLKSYFEKHRRQLVFSDEGLCHVGDADLKGHDSIKRVYHPKGKGPTLTTMQGGHREPKVLASETTWRKLTPLECERCMMLPDNYTEGVSNTQRYKSLGNSFCCATIEHILKGLL